MIASGSLRGGSLAILLIATVALIIVAWSGDNTVAANNFVNVNQNGVWIQNPVQQAKNKVHHKLYQLTPQYYKQRVKQKLFQSNGVAREIYELNHKAKNLKNALKAFTQ